MAAFVKLPYVMRVVGQGDTKCSVVAALPQASGPRILMNADLRVVSDEQFPFALNYFTGSKEHNIRMRQRAIEYGYKLNEYDLAGAKKGIKEVTGEILIDDRLFTRARGTGSGPDLLSPMIVNDNMVDIVVVPGKKSGELILGGRSERKRRGHAQRVVDARADIAVAGGEERRRAQRARELGRTPDHDAEVAWPPAPSGDRIRAHRTRE